ncbi:hypothetical protein EPUS_03105 [Endocarpon pusillum Z07020]|uniref:Uncharacterized protein n=1 Tax=Endocarpon pusillum (strain Z07020 / HMAS-L-300199) TaxID=1263415 RepID=U1GM07_ENDPU|nr:uncharacterized protein EPUS_03105 [Endocarpon pusillum Z07020]ERF73273.1 hypothetical protein EPUS_03105 [Endocarpon pusillum Z07020]
MADPLEQRSAPASRQISPIAQPPSPVKTKEEDEEITTNPDAAADQSTLSPAKEEDTEAIIALHAGPSASASPPATEENSLEGADTTGDVSTTDIQSKCVMSFLRPQPGKCSSKITNDDRHYISNFFGRNKTCSTNIPDDFYQVLCRKCMQSMKYRLKCNKEEKEVHSQVAAIKHVLRNMAASGKWVLLEVQLTKSEYDRRRDPSKYDKELKEFNDAIIKAREEAKQKGEVVKRRNTKPALVPVPDWLAELVVRSDDNADQDYTPVHEREPTRWTFEDMIGLVDLIGENCDVLPNIECLPVTQETQTKQLQRELQDFKKMLAEMEEQLEEAEEELQRALDQAASTQHTIPPKRRNDNKPGKKGESSKRVDRVAKKKKAPATTPTQDRASQDTLADPDLQTEPGTMASVDDDNNGDMDPRAAGEKRGREEDEDENEGQAGAKEKGSPVRKKVRRG